MWGLTVRATLSQLKESHGFHGNFYEGEQEQCQRISQWHKLCWSCAGVTFTGTTGQLSLSRFFPGPISNPCLPPAPAYLQQGVLVLVLVVVVFQLQFAMLGATLTSMANFVQG